MLSLFQAVIYFVRTRPEKIQSSMCMKTFRDNHFNMSEILVFITKTNLQIDLEYTLQPLRIDGIVFVGRNCDIVISAIYI